MACSKCGAATIDATDANDSTAVILDAEPNEEGVYSLSSCCPDHAPVARVATSPGARFRLHDCSIAG